jgi:hypothetical protein
MHSRPFLISGDGRFSFLIKFYSTKHDFAESAHLAGPPNLLVAVSPGNQQFTQGHW